MSTFIIHLEEMGHRTARNDKKSDQLTTKDMDHKAYADLYADLYSDDKMSQQPGYLESKVKECCHQIIIVTESVNCQCKIS